MSARTGDGVGLDRRVWWQKVGTAYAVVRAVRLLQARGVVPGHDGLHVAGVHVHHWQTGVLLAAGQLAVGGHGPVARAWRANVLATAGALLLDELDVCTGLPPASRSARTLRAVVDSVALAGALAGLRDTRRTWSGWYDAVVRTPRRGSAVRRRGW